MSDDNNVSVKKQDIHDDNQHVPELRFPGFTDEWNENRLDNIFKIKAAGDLNKNKFSKSKDKNHKYPVFANALENKGLLGYYTEFKYPSGSITITARGNIGIPIKRNIEFNAVGRLLILIPKENLNISFFTSCLNNIHFYIESTGVPQLTAPSLKIYKIKYPSIKEQKKIGDFISLIDRKIDLLEKKCELYKNFIKQKRNEIYNLETSNNKKLFKDIIIKSNKKNKSDNIDLPVLSINNKLGFITQKEQFKDYEVASSNKNNYKIVNKGDFAYNPARINVGSIAKLDSYDKGIISPMYIVFKPNEKLINPNYLNNYFKSEKFNYEMSKRLEGSVRLILSIDSLNNIPINLPSIEDQERFGIFFFIFDKKISNIEKKLNIMKQFKKGLLQKMFV